MEKRTDCILAAKGLETLQIESDDTSESASCEDLRETQTPREKDPGLEGLITELCNSYQKYQMITPEFVITIPQRQEEYKVIFISFYLCDSAF